MKVYMNFCNDEQAIKGWVNDNTHEDFAHNKFTYNFNKCDIT
jgi:hypothetical protein